MVNKVEWSESFTRSMLLIYFFISIPMRFFFRETIFIITSCEILCWDDWFLFTLLLLIFCLFFILFSIFFSILEHFNNLFINSIINLTFNFLSTLQLNNFFLNFDLYCILYLFIDSNKFNFIIIHHIIDFFINLRIFNFDFIFRNLIVFFMGFFIFFFKELSNVVVHIFFNFLLFFVLFRFYRFILLLL